MLYYARGSEDTELTPDEIKQAVFDVYAKLSDVRKVLALPPDFTRFHSQAGYLTQLTYEYFGKALTDILPALGTHAPMTEEQLNGMF